MGESLPQIGNGKAVMCHPCPHAWVTPEVLLPWGNGTARGLTCPRCWEGQGVHVVIAHRKNGEQLWRLLIVKLWITPKGRALRSRFYGHDGPLAPERSIYTRDWLPAPPETL